MSCWCQVATVSRPAVAGRPAQTRQRLRAGVARPAPLARVALKEGRHKRARHEHAPRLHDGQHTVPRYMQQATAPRTGTGRHYHAGGARIHQHARHAARCVHRVYKMYLTAIFCSRLCLNAGLCRSEICKRFAANGLPVNSSNRFDWFASQFGYPTRTTECLSSLRLEVDCDWRRTWTRSRPFCKRLAS
jgi:hypothetical protein